MAPRIVLNGVTQAQDEPVVEGSTCLALVPVRPPGRKRDSRVVQATLVSAAEESARFFAALEDNDYQEMARINDSSAAITEVDLGVDEDDDDDDEEPDFEDLFDKAYELLQEVEDGLDALINRSATPMTRRMKARMVGLGTDVSNYLNTYKE